MTKEVSLENLESFAQELASKIRHTIILLKGDLGAGKTTLVRALLKKLNSCDVVSSPTFGIVNEYTIRERSAFHLDLYRIEKSDELLQFGFEEYIHANGYCFIEWPEIAMDFIPENHHLITIEPINDTTRKITFI